MPLEKKKKHRIHRTRNRRDPTQMHTSVRVHARFTHTRMITPFLFLSVTQHLILCASSHCCGYTTLLLEQGSARNTLASCHTRRVSMSREQLKGPCLPASLSPSLLCCHFPTCFCLNWVSLSLSGTLLSATDTHSCEAELT